MRSFSYLFHSLVVVVIAQALGCATVPEEKHKVFKFPEKWVFVETPTGPLEKHPYEIKGRVQARATYSTLDLDTSIGDQSLCRNYYNKAAADLLMYAKKAGSDAVMNVRSIVYTLEGRPEEYKTPECSDDGGEGEILLIGLAIKFKRETPQPVPSPSK